MRITSNIIRDTILNDISSSYERMGKYQTQLTSGKLYQEPSDNPAAINQALSIKAKLKDMEQYKSNIDDGLAWLNTTESALRSGVDVLHRVREIAVNGSNGTNSQSELNALASEVDQLLNNMVNIGNSTYADRYIFAGFKTTTVPFSKNGTPPPEINYNGDGGAINLEIEKGVNVQINLDGNTAFKSSTDVFQVMATLRDDLRNNPTAVSQDIGQVDSAMSKITDSLTTLGAKINRLTLTKDKIDQNKIDLSKILGDLEDADLPEVITKLKTEETVYQSALMAGSMVMQKSLIDFLR